MASLLLIILAYLVIIIGFGLYSITIFYHINRYSYIGDASKRVFLIYMLITLTVILVGLFLIIANHIF